jgi:hypothetical protein
MYHPPGNISSPCGTLPARSHHSGLEKTVNEVLTRPQAIKKISEMIRHPNCDAFFLGKALWCPVA